MTRLYTAILLALCLFYTSSCVQFPETTSSIQVERNLQKGSLKPIWLICGALHSDFVTETSWLIDSGCQLPKSLRAYKYVCFGWGDEEAYTNRWGTEDIPYALMWPSKSIVHVVGFNGSVTGTFPRHEVIFAKVSATNGSALSAFLNDSFAFHSDRPNDPVTLRPAKWGYGYFIKSNYTYYFPRMCNQWVSVALQKAGVNTTKPTVTMSSQTLKRDINEYNKKQTSSAL